MNNTNSTATIERAVDLRTLLEARLMTYQEIEADAPADDWRRLPDADPAFEVYVCNDTFQGNQERRWRVQYDDMAWADSPEANAHAQAIRFAAFQADVMNSEPGTFAYKIEVEEPTSEEVEIDPSIAEDAYVQITLPNPVTPEVGDTFLTRKLMEEEWKLELAVGIGALTLDEVTDGVLADVQRSAFIAKLLTASGI